MPKPISTLPLTGRHSFFSFPLEIRTFIYEELLVSQTPLPPKPPQSKQLVFTAILRTNWHVYHEAIDILYGRNHFTLHLRSHLDKVTYEPFLSSLTAENASKIKQPEIILWGNYDEENGDTILFGTNNFGVPLKNLVHAPKIVVAIDIVKTKTKDPVDEPDAGSTTFCAFDWLLAAFANEWYFSKTYFDLFRAVARFHLGHMCPHLQIKKCESQWFREARVTPGLKEDEQKRFWDMEERYGLRHEDDSWSYGKETYVIKGDGVDGDDGVDGVDGVDRDVKHHPYVGSKNTTYGKEESDSG